MVHAVSRLGMSAPRWSVSALSDGFHFSLSEMCYARRLSPHRSPICQFCSTLFILFVLLLPKPSWGCTCLQKHLFLRWLEASGFSLSDRFTILA